MKRNDVVFLHETFQCLNGAFPSFGPYSQRSKNIMKVAFEHSAFFFCIKILTVVNSKSFTLNSRALTWSRSLVQANFLNLFKCSKIIWGPNFYKKKNFLFWPVQNFFFKFFLCPGHSADSEESIGTYKGHILTLYRPYKKAIKIYPIKTLYGVFFGTF